MKRNEKGIKLLKQLAVDSPARSNCFSKLDEVREGIEAAIQAGVSTRKIARALSASEFDVSHQTVSLYLKARNIGRSSRPSKGIHKTKTLPAQMFRIQKNEEDL